MCTEIAQRKPHKQTAFKEKRRRANTELNKQRKGQEGFKVEQKQSGRA